MASQQNSLFHQAPEVVQDHPKYPISYEIHEPAPAVTPQDITGPSQPDVPSRSYDEKSEPDPQRIGGMRRKTFWLLVGLISIVVVGAAVGGAVGGSTASKGTNNKAPATVTISQTPTSITASSTSDSSSSSSAPTALSSSSPVNLTATSYLCPDAVYALSDCPDANGTTFILDDGQNGAYSFRKYCGFNNVGSNIAQVCVPTFNMCIQLCANINYLNGDTRCRGVDFDADGGGSQAGNCWAKNGTNVEFNPSGVQSALLD